MSQTLYDLIVKVLVFHKEQRDETIFKLTKSVKSYGNARNKK